jgi:hypothetical protein
MSDENKKVAVKFKGELRYANLPPRPAQKKYEPKPEEINDTSYSVLVECPKEKFKELQKAGIPALTKLVEDEETGKTFLRIRATKTKKIGDKLMEFKDPDVVNKYDQPITESIGNGSTGIVIAELGPIKGRKGKALRLVGVQVLNLIPYEGGGLNKYKDLLESEEVADGDASYEEVQDMM